MIMRRLFLADLAYFAAAERSAAQKLLADFLRAV